MSGELVTYMSGSITTPIKHPTEMGLVPSQTEKNRWEWVALPLRYWVPNWQPDTYLLGTVTMDSGWLMVSNKDTAERPAPQPSDDPSWSISDTPTFATNGNTSVVYSGHIYTVLTEGWIDSVRVWVPTVTATTNYRFIIQLELPGGAIIRTVIEEPVLNENGWTYLGQAATLVAPGTIVTVLMDSLEGSSTTDFNGDWVYAGNSNTEGPISGQWNNRNQDDVIRLHKFGELGTDHSTQLEAVIVNTVITVIQASEVLKRIKYRVDQVPIDGTTYMEYHVTRIETGSLGDPDIGSQCLINVKVPIAAATQYVQETDTWNTQPDWATVEGFLQYNGVPQGGVSNDGFGIDIRFQPASIPDDWDLMSLAGTGASSSAQSASALEITATRAQSVTPTLGVSKYNDIFIAIDQDTKQLKLISESDMLNPNGVLEGHSVATSQEPTALDTPIQIEFGPLQSTTDVDLAADGTITINTDGIYIFKLIVQFGRTGVPGTSDIRFRALIAGSPIGRTEAIKLSDDAFIGRVFDYGEVFLPAGTTLAYEMYRDSAGHNSGGLFQATSTLAGWASAPSASVIIQKR